MLLFLGLPYMFRVYVSLVHVSCFSSHSSIAGTCAPVQDVVPPSLSELAISEGELSSRSSAVADACIIRCPVVGYLSLAQSSDRFLGYHVVLVRESSLDDQYMHMQTLASLTCTPAGTGECKTTQQSIDNCKHAQEL